MLSLCHGLARPASGDGVRDRAKYLCNQYGDTAMSRFFARSALIDALGRLSDLLLFVILLPFVVILSRRPGIDRLLPEDSHRKSGRRVPKAA